MADSDLSLEGLLARIPTAATPTPNPQCCCGRKDCAFLAYNGTALDNLEQEVRTAASLGQALLIRHEQYMANAEKERLEMSARIEKLESDKKELAAENARNIEDNRGLLDQLEELNSTVAESETHIKSLEATLQSANQELRRLEGLASRTHDLEMQLAALEQEQANLQRTVIITEAQERSAIQRWKKAERGIQDLNDQLERIERESREERERHVEVLGRMERQRAVERELDTAAGRLKGAAAVTSGGKNGSQVVSHFVKDILQDNANLQLGIVELREMLMNSNDEVQTLREQLALHSPIARDEDGSGQRTMRAEMGPKEEMEQHVVSQELHIHHHYHAPAKKETPRPRKKRASLNSVIFTPPQMSSPRTPRSRATSNAILSQTSVTIPQPLTPNNTRWSVQSSQMSDFAPSSVPSSPISNYRHSGLFDRGFDSSRPTSPISSVGGLSIDPMSPGFQPHHRKRNSSVSTRSFAQPVNFQPENIIHEEDDDVEEIPGLETSEPSLEGDFGQSGSSDHSDVNYSESWAGTAFQPSLRRSASHESILSISGIDIHTLKSRPSQITITGSSAHLRPRTRSSLASVETLTGSSMVTARPILSRQGHDSRAYLRSSMGQAHSDTDSIRSSNSNEGPGMGKKVGGWFVGRWGVSPAKSMNELHASAPTPSPQNRSVSTPVAPDPLRALMGRPPGVNQKGPIPGFKKSDSPIPSIVTPVVVDHEALRETLLEAENLGT